MDVLVFSGHGYALGPDVNFFLDKEDDALTSLVRSRLKHGGTLIIGACGSGKNLEHWTEVAREMGINVIASVHDTLAGPQSKYPHTWRVIRPGGLTQSSW